MNIEPLFRSIHDVLRLGFFFVPRFQRPYSWDEQQLEEFWQDCVVDQADSEYFIGSVVLFKESGKHGIVDGQQRLTTVTMILCALRDAFVSHGSQNLADGLNHLIVRPNIDNKLQAVLASESSVPYFQTAIQRIPDVHHEPATSVEEKRLEGAFAFIRSRIDDAIADVRSSPRLSELKKRERIEARLVRFRDRILGLKAIALTLDTDVDAYMIFETLNTRGKDLELGDLIRTHLTKCMPQTNATTDQVRKKFDELRKAFDLNSRKLDDFMLHFWLSRKDYIAKRKIYKQLRKDVKKANAGAFFADFLEDGKLYLDITVPSRRDWTVEEMGLEASLEALRLFRVEQPNPFVLAVARAYAKKKISLKLTKRAVAAVENFHFAFTAITSSRSSGGISQMYARHASAIAKRTASHDIAKEIKQLIDKLRSRYPSRDEFIAEFRELAASEKLTRGKALVRYVLHKLSENHMRRAYDTRKMTIEHLASQSGTGHSLSEETVAEIGNLSWVPEGIQERLGTKKISAKVQILRSQGCWIDQSLEGHKGDWDRQAIRRRTDHLAQLAYDSVWKVV